MPFAGGVYTLPSSSDYPAVADTEIDPDDHNTSLADIATGLNQTFLRDGSATATGDFPMGGFKIKGLGAASGNGQALRYEQVIGVFQPLDATLTALAGLTTSAAQYLRSTGTDAFTMDSYATVISNLAVPTLAASNTFTANQNITKSAVSTAFLSFTNQFGTFASFGISANSYAAMMDGSQNPLIEYDSNKSLFTFRTSSAAVMGILSASGLQAQVATSTETSGSLTAVSANTQVNLAGNITLAASVFTAGDKMVFDPGTSSRTITRGSGCTMYVNGVDSATATISANQMAGVEVRTGGASSVFVLSGAVS